MPEAFTFIHSSIELNGGNDGVVLLNRLRQNEEKKGSARSTTTANSVFSGMITVNIRSPYLSKDSSDLTEEISSRYSQGFRQITGSPA
ncbi:hypothetical protein [Paraburkholderia metrosideri]|uniref:hypothetical protein n=1 Tax=Paraburkholderia metrosideri TaxID=580937 RepID=UPI001919B8F3|nr:hypothetical protein [Paraburkholderia metrosideri]